MASTAVNDYKVNLTASVKIADVLGVEAFADEMEQPHTGNRAEAVRRIVPAGLAAAVIAAMRRRGYGVTICDNGNGNEEADHVDCRFWSLEDDRRRGMMVEGSFVDAVRGAAAAALELTDPSWEELLVVEGGAQ